MIIAVDKVNNRAKIVDSDTAILICNEGESFYQCYDSVDWFRESITDVLDKINADVIKRYESIKMCTIVDNDIETTAVIERSCNFYELHIIRPLYAKPIVSAFNKVSKRIVPVKFKVYVCEQLIDRNRMIDNLKEITEVFETFGEAQDFFDRSINNNTVTATIDAYDTDDVYVASIMLSDGDFFFRTVSSTDSAIIKAMYQFMQSKVTNK